MKRMIFLLISLFYIQSMAFAGEGSSNSKENEPGYTKNLLIGTGNVWVMGSSSSLTYERILHVGNSGYFSAAASYGKWKDTYEDGDLFALTGNYMLGKKNHQLEMNLGALVKVHYDQYYTDRNKFDHLSFLPDVYAGYRYKKPSGHLVLKAGVGFPSLVSAGVGLAF
jgi:hypothetical protein